jgi:hypothetical protein
MRWPIASGQRPSAPLIDALLERDVEPVSVFGIAADTGGEGDGFQRLTLHAMGGLVFAVAPWVRISA